MRTVWVLGLLMMVGCAPHHQAPGAPRMMPPNGFPNSIAVLPLANDTLSIEGPKILRVRLRRRMKAFGYTPQKVGDTDERLRSIGVTLGGQIPATTWQELHTALGTDAVLTGRLIKHSAVVTGLVNTRTVEAEVVMTDLRTGKILWHAREKVQEVESIAAQAAGNNGGDGRAAAALCLIGGVVGLVSGATQHDMRQENEQLATLLCHKTPYAGPPTILPAPAATPGATPKPGTTPSPVATPANVASFSYPAGIQPSASALAIAPAGAGPALPSSTSTSSVPDPKPSSKEVKP